MRRRPYNLGSRRAILLLTVVLASVAGACGTQGLAFEDSSRVRDIHPAPLASSTLPVKLRWRAASLPDGYKFLVLVDQSPMEPGQSINELVDDICKKTKGCPDKLYLNSHFLFKTTDNGVEIPTVPLGGAYDIDDLSNMHRATIVVLDEHNRRVGEQVWSVDFRVKT